MEQTTPKSNEGTVSIFDPTSITTFVAEEAERRKVLQKYIRDHLKEKVDYGNIPGLGRATKPCLFKPGAEKFCSLLQLRADFLPDKDTIEMIKDDKTSTIAYICRLVHIPTSLAVAEGRGACTLAERQNNPNTAIKIAEKRAMVDAVLRLGLSDSFTQDEDTIDVSPQAMAPPAPVERAKAVKKVAGACENCGEGITASVLNYSTRQHGKALCFSCQAKLSNHSGPF